MILHKLGGLVGVAGLMTVLAVSAEAQVKLTGTNYTQNFNSLSNGLPPGWSVRTNATATSLGTPANFNTNVVSWGTQTGQFGNAAGITNNSLAVAVGTETAVQQISFTNRCLSLRQTVSYADPGAAFVFQIENTTGFSNLTFSVDLNMLSVQPHSTVWTVDYAVGNSPASFTLLGTYSDTGVFGATTQIYSLGADADNQSENVWIRIVALSPATGSSGNRDSFGIDNFSLSWTTNAQAVVAPVTPAIAAVAMIGGSVQIDFNAGTADVPPSFVVVGSPQITGTYSDAGAVITPLGQGSFRATCAANGPQQFYRIKRP
jgi:hypothetical protein